MTEKTLTEADWKKVAKARGLKDAALLKALAELAKAKAPDTTLAALDDIDKQVELLRKAGKADKDLLATLDDMAKATARERKLAEADNRKAAAAPAADDDDADAPELLTSKMAPLLRQVPKGETLQALLAATGKASAVLLSRRAIGPPRRKLLSAYLGVTSGVKFIPATCIWEANAHTFVVQGAAGGLAKKLKAALLEQTGLRCKVRVRGDDPADIEEDLEADAAGVAAHADGNATAGANADASTSPVSAGADPLPAFKARLAALVASLKPALASGAADGDTQRQRVAQAGAAAHGRNFDAAHRLLDQVDEWLRAAPAASGLVALQQSRLDWDGLRKTVQAQLRALEDAVLAGVRAHNADDAATDGYDEAEVATRVRSLYGILDRLDTRLIDTLDGALNASGAERSRLHAQAAGLVRDYQAYVDADPLVAEIDANGFVATSIRSEAQRTLAALAQRLQAA